MVVPTAQTLRVKGFEMLDAFSYYTVYERERCLNGMSSLHSETS
jgi:hypothetical protein